MEPENPLCLVTALSYSYNLLAGFLDAISAGLLGADASLYSADESELVASLLATCSCPNLLRSS